MIMLSYLCISKLLMYWNFKGYLTIIVEEEKKYL